MNASNIQICLARRPSGWVRESDFNVVRTGMPNPGEGQILLKSLFLSLDPYMRLRMDDAKSYAPPVEIGAVMVGGTVSEVIASRHPGYRPGDIVTGMTGWQLFALSDGKLLRPVDPALAPLSAALGVVGMPGVTAWVGLLDIGMPKAGETVVVSAASGAVGSVAGQIAKIKGCRIVGIAGGAVKCEYVTRELGFDACIDYRGGDLHGQLAAACPNGVDVYFDNVGGEILDTLLQLLNPFARIALCGLISQYNEVENTGLKNLRSLLVNRVRLQGFIVSDHLNRFPPALAELGQWYKAGRLKYRESVAHGIENAPRAFIGMLRGENFGKQVVKLV